MEENWAELNRLKAKHNVETHVKTTMTCDVHQTDRVYFSVALLTRIALLILKEGNQSIEERLAIS